jgi:hypothetical protein
MAITTPDWLTRHGGSLREGVAGRSWIVWISEEPQYRLVPVPAAGKFACDVTQTVNGRRLEGKETYPSLDAAVQGGLEDLRRALGW